MLTAIFFPENHLDRLLSSSLSFLEPKPTQKSSHVLTDFTLFKPKYYGQQVLKPQQGSHITGNLVLLNQNDLKLMDAVLEEGTMYSRLNASVSAIDSTVVEEDTQIYVWNGNCLIGEWEHMD